MIGIEIGLAAVCIFVRRFDPCDGRVEELPVGRRRAALPVPLR